MGEISKSSSDEDLEYLTSFYRIIMPSVLREHRLVLPKEFVEEYGKELSRTIRLEEACVGGDIWHIKVKKTGSVFCLQDGWENFMKHHSIGFGYFLVFKYKGNSQFHLRIFDLTAIEIDYSKSSRQQLPTHLTKTVKTENDEPFPNVFVAGHQPREEGGVSSKRKACNESPPRKMQRQQRVGRKQYSSKRITFSMKDEKVRNSSSKSDMVKKEPTLNQEGERKRDNPIFTLQMTALNVKRYTVYLPMKFSKENIRDYAEYFELEDSDDPTRRWRVQCHRYDLRWSLGKGWIEFVKEKRLEEGDECVFQIIAKGIMKVSVFHVKSDGECDGNQSHCTKNLDDEEEKCEKITIASRECV